MIGILLPVGRAAAETRSVRPQHAMAEAPINTMDKHATLNAELWRLWKEHGVTEHVVLAVDFRFYTAHKPNADALIAILLKAGFTIVHNRPRTVLIFRGHEIIATERGHWTLGRLQARAREFVELGNKLKLLYEGFGAEMP